MNYYKKKIVKKGLAEIKYIYGDYKYLDILNDAQDEAKKNKLNIWSNTSDDSILYNVIVVISIIVIIVVFKPKKNTVKKLVTKYL